MPAWWLAPCLVVSGLTTAPLLALFYSMMSDAAPVDVLTEAYAWEMTGTMAGIALGTAAAGVLATFVGVGGVFIVATVAVLASSLIWTRRATTVISRSDRLRPTTVSSSHVASRSELQPVDALSGRDWECMECGC
jgi:MFS family permease